MTIPKNHPRYASLKTRELIVKGVENRITSLHGLIAHGRGEAFDYLLGEKTTNAAKKSIDAAAALLLLAKYPVISVNGNAAALAPRGLAQLAKTINARLEANIFHPSKKRELKIKKHLEKNGAKNVLLPQKSSKINFLDSNRKYSNPDGILKADAVFAPLEDGDRAEALMKNGKKVITIDLNPMSRTAQKSAISIVDNITRAIPLLAKQAGKFKKYDKNRLKNILKNYNNRDSLDNSLKYMLKNLP